MDLHWNWPQEYLLEIVACVLTIVLIYHYIIEKDSGLKLSKSYRNSVLEAQTKNFLNAIQYLISGDKDMAIKEFFNAVELNRKTVDAYFALGGLLRSSGEIEKSISIHKSLVAREDISDFMRLRALKELAMDFARGGFIDKAIETYKDVLKINRDQYDVLQSLSRIYENIQDWEQAYNYRVMMNKVGHENQAETISHILVQKAKVCLKKGELGQCQDDLENAFRFAPSVSAKILKLQLFLVKGDIDSAKHLLMELLKESPEYITFIFESLEEDFESDLVNKSDYTAHFNDLKKFFLETQESSVPELSSSPSVVLVKVRLLKEMGKVGDAYQLMSDWMKSHSSSSDALQIEYIKLLVNLEKREEAVEQTRMLLENLHRSLTKHYCKNCGHDSDEIFWRCPQCHKWETIQFRWKV